jgi:peptide/nickel transport system substrate-binding protein
VDKMEEEGASITDPQKRIEFHEAVQERIQEQAAFGWSVEPYYRSGISNKLRGFRWYTTQYYEVYQTSFKD